MGPSGIWYANVGRVMIDMLALEMVFLAVLFAVVVNIRWRRKPRAEKPPQKIPSQERPLQFRDWLSPVGMFTAAVIAVAVLTILYVLVRTALQQ